MLQRYLYGCRLCREIRPTFFIMDAELLRVLKELRDNRRRNHIAPEFIPQNELPRRKQGWRNELNDAYKEGYIKVHRGINHNLIELVKDGDNE